MSTNTPDLGAVIAALETGGPAALAAFSAPTPDRAIYLAANPKLSAVVTTDVAIGGPHGDVPARIYRHQSLSKGVAIVWVHGGGFVGGDLEMAEAHWVGLALAVHGYGVLSVDYRKCIDGIHYPVPSDDVRAAWSWAADNAHLLGATPERLAIGGASAGGSLAAGVVKAVRDQGGPLPASVILVYPTLHPELALPSNQIPAHVPPQLAHAREVIKWMNLNYAGSQARLDDPYAFPGIGDVGRQPPVYIVTCETDLLRTSGEAYAESLQAAGVPVTLETEPDTGHGHLNDPLLPSAPRTIERMLGWLSAIESPPTDRTERTQ